eukprot:13653049-Alexandrium_andersonii.AAC.1
MACRGSQQRTDWTGAPGKILGESCRTLRPKSARTHLGRGAPASGGIEATTLERAHPSPKRPRASAGLAAGRGPGTKTTPAPGRRLGRARRTPACNCRGRRAPPRSPTTAAATTQPPGGTGASALAHLQECTCSGGVLTE